MSTGVFLSIRANLRPLSFQWIPTKQTFSPISSYSTPASVSIPLQLFEVTFNRTLSFSKQGYLLLKVKFFPRLKALRCILLPHEPLSLLHKAFLRPLLTYASPGWFPFLSVTNITKLERLHRSATRAISFMPLVLL